jgi:hypothetical protein
MKPEKKLIYVTGILIMFFLFSCEKAETDTELPVIEMTGQNHFPQNCDTVYIGESFTFSALFTDNFELGSYSVDIHHNFDHHSHSTDMTDCPMDPVRTPVNPLLFIRQYDIPGGQTRYDAEQEIFIPADADTGDYHMMVRLTDKTGWQAIRGISIKILRRD